MVVVCGGYALLRELHRGGWSEPGRHVLVAVVAVVALVVVGTAYALLPDGGGPVDAPANLVWGFPLFARDGLTLFFAALGADFGARRSRPSATAVDRAGGVTPVLR